MAFWRKDPKKILNEAKEVEREIESLRNKFADLVKKRDYRNPEFKTIKNKLESLTKKHLKLLRQVSA